MRLFGKSASLDEIRHSLAHLLAAAVKELYGEGAKFSLGPAIENGFYYDFQFPENNKPGSEDLKRIEDKMREILPSWNKFEGREVDVAAAKSIFLGNEFKRELIDEIQSRGEKITVYKSGDFEDLCRGGHVKNAKDIPADAFKLDKIAGAYWRGDEKNPQMTRIYGLAFESKEKLEEYLKMREEAEKRDHKKLGPQLDLFTFSDLVGAGLPLWTPKGTLMRHLLDDFVWSLRKERGYVKVDIPHLAKKDLYERSGHWDKFQNELFKITTREGHLFVLKPMNCPHHVQIFARRPFSYRQMPQRYATTTMQYRDEQSGELSGLSRVRAISIDDAHVFCRMNQIKDEVKKIYEIVQTVYAAFELPLKIRLSIWDSKHPENYLGTKELWQKAVDSLEHVLYDLKRDFVWGIGEAAFYGPKIDFIATDALGREWQVATIQLDMNQPERFDLYCINEKGERERIVMIHAAIMGSLERFMSILIEHFAGAFPLWLAPVQVVVLPVSEKFAEYGNKVVSQLQTADIRAELSDPNETLNKRIREAEMQKIPYILVVGEKEMNAVSVSPRHYKRGQENALSIAEFTSLIQDEIEKKTI